MKTSFFLTAFCLIGLSAFLLYTKFDLNDNSTSVRVTEDNDSYSFDAHYNPDKSAKVLRYLDENIEVQGLAKNENTYFDTTTMRIDATTILSDKTECYIKESPGKLKIEFDKRKNTSASYFRIKKMCEGIKQLVAGK